MNNLELLQKYWGHKSFKPLQEESIDSITSGVDTVGLFPTGSGKSLCYQLPALSSKGLVLVVSPLIALMEDQVKNLKDKGIKAMYFQSNPKSIPISQQIDNCIHGNYKVVYISPERLIQKPIIQQLSFAKISFLAVDEAHCISEWGHDFRPAYRKINILRTVFPDLPVLALTATATPKVLLDIKDYLELKNPNVFQKSFERSNISYNLWKTENKYDTTVQILKYFSGSSIVYCNTRKETERLSGFLNKSGVKSDFYHGGLFPDAKKYKLESWQKEKTIHMVATTAFGMGIDKSNVRTIIHLNLPQSIENYSQETGRAGRDGKRAKAFLLFQDSDPNGLKNQFLDQTPTATDLKAIYKDLYNYLQIAYGDGFNETYTLDLERFCERYNHASKKTLQCFNQFDQEGIMIVSSSKEKQLIIKSKCSPEQATEYIQLNHIAAKVLEYLMRQHLQFFSVTTTLSVQSICSKFKLSVERTSTIMSELQKRGLIEFSFRNKNLYITPQVPREDNYSLKPVITTARIKYTQKKEKIEKLIAFVLDNTNCKSNLILEYFGNETKVSCGQCSSLSCKTELETESNFESKVIKLIKQAPHSIKDLKQKLYFEPIAILQLLEKKIRENKIKENNEHKFYWNI
jgi:ATP-dependent DNA helicase RecQ